MLAREFEEKRMKHPQNGKGARASSTQSPFQVCASCKKKRTSASWPLSPSHPIRPSNADPTKGPSNAHIISSYRSYIERLDTSYHLNNCQVMSVYMCGTKPRPRTMICTVVGTQIHALCNRSVNQCAHKCMLKRCAP